MAQWGAGRWAHVPRLSLPKILDRVAWSRRVGVSCSVQGLATPIGTRLESSLASGLGGRKASPGRAPARSPPKAGAGAGQPGEDGPLGSGSWHPPQRVA